MLKTRQQLGYFPLLDEVPEQIVGFLRGALGFTADTVLLDARVKTKTLFRYRDLIRAYLGTRAFGDGGQQLIESVIRSAALTMSDPADLINLAIETLSKDNVELPAFSALDRLIGHLRQEVHATLYRSITADLTHEGAAALDALLEVLHGENLSPFARFKESPGPATLHHIRQWADRLAELDAIIDSKPFLGRLAHTKIRQFAAEASRMQIGDLRDLTQPGKRHTLLLCFLQLYTAWNRQDPPDAWEIERNRRIERVQGVGNRYINDYAALSGRAGTAM